MSLPVRGAFGSGERSISRLDTTPSGEGYLTYLTGLRIGEALALEVRDVDLDRFKVHVTRGKTGERVVPLPDDPKLQQSLSQWLQVRATWSPPGDLLFVTRSSEPLDAAAVRRSMELYGSRSGIGHVTPHMLGHSAATELLANGAPPIGVQRVLGHKRLSTMLDVYASAADNHAAQAMSRR